MKLCSGRARGRRRKDGEDMFEVKYPNVTVQLSGENGNAFAIIGAVSKALKRAYRGDDPQFETNQEAHEAAAAYRAEAMASESYDALLQHAMKTVNVE